MARMSREFELVLVGAGLLVAAAFLWPEDDPVKRAAEPSPGRVIFFPAGRTTVRDTADIRDRVRRAGAFFFWD